MESNNKTSSKKEEEIDSSEEDSSFSQGDIYRIAADQEIQKKVSKMSEEDLERYETFRCTNLPKGTIKKLINNIIGQAVNPNIVIAINGVSKVFIGEMIDEAKLIQKEKNESGPLLPSHIHEAHRRLYKRLPNMSVFKRAPWN